MGYFATKLGKATAPTNDKPAKTSTGGGYFAKKYSQPQSQPVQAPTPGVNVFKRGAIGQLGATTKQQLTPIYRGDIPTTPSPNIAKDKGMVWDTIRNIPSALKETLTTKKGWKEVTKSLEGMSTAALQPFVEAGITGYRLVQGVTALNEYQKAVRSGDANKIKKASQKVKDFNNNSDKPVDLTKLFAPGNTINPTTGKQAEGTGYLAKLMPENARALDTPGRVLGAGLQIGTAIAPEFGPATSVMTRVLLSGGPKGALFFGGSAAENEANPGEIAKQAVIGYLFGAGTSAATETLHKMFISPDKTLAKGAINAGKEQAALQLEYKGYKELATKVRNADLSSAKSPADAGKIIRSTILKGQSPDIQELGSNYFASMQQVIDQAARIKAGKEVTTAGIKRPVPAEDVAIQREFPTDGSKPQDVLIKKSTGETLTVIKTATEKQNYLENGYKPTTEVATVPDRVVQVKHPDESVSVYRIPADQAKEIIGAVDNNRTTGGKNNSIAGMPQSNGDIWHVTAKTPENMLSKPNTIDAGVIKLENIPKAEAPKVVSPEQKSVEAGVGNKTSGVAKSIEAKAIEAKLTKGFKDLAQYDSSNIKEQASLSTDLINSGIDNARAVLRGDKPLPEGLRGSSFVLSMEEYLKKNPNAEIYAELANSPLVSGISQAGSELGLIQNRIQDTATQKLMDIRKAREAKIEDLPKKRSSATKSLKEELKKSNLTKEELSFDKFLDSITC